MRSIWEAGRTGAERARRRRGAAQGSWATAETPAWSPRAESTAGGQPPPDPIGWRVSPPRGALSASIRMSGQGSAPRPLAEPPQGGGVRKPARDGSAPSPARPHAPSAPRRAPHPTPRAATAEGARVAQAPQAGSGSQPPPSHDFALCRPLLSPRPFDAPSRGGAGDRNEDGLGSKRPPHPRRRETEHVPPPRPTSAAAALERPSFNCASALTALRLRSPRAQWQASPQCPRAGRRPSLPAVRALGAGPARAAVFGRLLPAAAGTAAWLCPGGASSTRSGRGVCVCVLAGPPCPAVPARQPASGGGGGQPGLTGQLGGQWRKRCRKCNPGRGTGSAHPGAAGGAAAVGAQRSTRSQDERGRLRQSRTGSASPFPRLLRPESGESSESPE